MKRLVMFESIIFYSTSWGIGRKVFCLLENVKLILGFGYLGMNWPKSVQMMMMQNYPSLS